jgi:hypothetical protein
MPPNGSLRHAWIRRMPLRRNYFLTTVLRDTAHKLAQAIVARVYATTRAF